MRLLIDYAANGIVLTLGMFHTIMTLLYERPFDLDALMYVGAGLAFIFLVVCNVARIKSTQKTIRILSLVCNIVALVYVVLIALEFADPRAFVVTLALIALVIMAAIDVIVKSTNRD